MTLSLGILMIGGSPSLFGETNLENDGFRFFVDRYGYFADLCAPTAAEMERFSITCVIVGLTLSVIGFLLIRLLRGSAGIKVSPTGCILSILAILVLSVSVFWGTTQLFPDPRDNGDLCGWTPDTIFLPFISGFIVPITFAAGYGLLLAIFSRIRSDQ